MCSSLILCSVLINFIYCSSIFDQSQRGELNVQVDLKGLQIIALMKGGKEEYVDYDYAYDYSEMTIKPQNGTTPKPLNITSANTVKDNITAGNTDAIEETTTSINNNTSLNLDTTELMTITDLINTENTTNVEISNENYTVKNKNVNLTSSYSTDCKRGFVRNHKGSCQLKLQNSSNALLKLVKLSQKLKLRRDNRRKQDDVNNLE